IPGMRISAIRHAVWCCWPESRNSSADANACAGHPTAFSMPCNALRIRSSSSTIATSLVLPSMAILETYQQRKRGAIIRWYTGTNTDLKHGAAIVFGEGGTRKQQLKTGGPRTGTCRNDAYVLL